MKIWELDPVDDDELVGQLNYPNLTTTLDCSFSQCGPHSSAWVNPSSGNTGLLSAQISMNVFGVYDEEPLLTLTEELMTGGYRLGSAALLATPAARLQVASQSTGSVAGYVLGPERIGIPQARVQIVNRRPVGLEIRTVLTEEDGRFELKDLEPGRKELLIVAAGHGRARVEITVLPGGTEYLEVRLERGSRVSGVVLDSNGNPVSGVRIVIDYPPERSGKALDRIEANWHRGMLITSEDGRFEVEDIQPNIQFSIFLEHPVKGRKLVGTYRLRPSQSITDLVVRWE